MKYIYSSIVILIFLNLFIETKEIIFQKIKKISLTEESFVVLDTGLYIYNSNFSECSVIYSFNDSQKINGNYEFTLEEFKNDEHNFIICLIKKYLYIYDYKMKAIFFYYLKELDNNKAIYYDLLPYKFENNSLNFIISFIDSTNKCIKIVYYDFNLKEDKIYFRNIKSYVIDYNMFSSSYINCQIYSLSDKKIICFFFEKNFDYNFQNIIIGQDNISDDGKKDIIKSFFFSDGNNKIKASYNNKIFVCFYYNDGFDQSSYCFLNELDKFNQISCESENNCKDFDTYYFPETNEFIFICKVNNNNIKATILNNSYTEEFRNCHKRNFVLSGCNNANSFSLIYNDSSNDYNIITNCNFTDTSICKFHQNDENFFITNTIKESFILDNTNIIESTQIKIYNISIKTEIKEITDNSEIIEKKEEIIFEYMDIYKEELKDKINDIIKVKKIGRNYEIKGKDFTLKIKPTNSTIFDNSTHVDFDECEKKLRKYYNISEASI